jgi:WD40 repeat protein
MFLPSRTSNSVSGSPANAANVEYQAQTVSDYRYLKAEAPGTSVLLPSPTTEVAGYAKVLNVIDTAVEVAQNASLGKVQNWRCVHSFTRNSQAVAFSPNGKMLASGSTHIKLWNTDGQEIGIIKRNSGILKALAFSGDGKTLISSGLSQRIELWDVASGEKIREFTPQGYAVNTLAFNPNSKMFVSGDRAKAIQVWNADCEQTTAVLVQHDDWVNSLAIHPNGIVLASGSYDKTIKIRNFDSPDKVLTFNVNSPVFALAFNGNGTMLASGSADATVRIWNWRTSEVVKKFKGHADEVYCIAISPDSKTLASGSADKTVKLWNLDSGKEIATFTGHTSSVKTVTFSSDGQTIASADANGTVRVWQRG